MNSPNPQLFSRSLSTDYMFPDRYRTLFDQVDKKTATLQDLLETGEDSRDMKAIPPLELSL